MTFIIGEVDSIVKRQPGLIAEDNFADGPAGWTQLLNGNVGAGVTYLDTEITYDGSPYSLFLGTEDYSSASHKPWGYAAAIKRLSRADSTSSIRMEFWFAYGSLHGEDTPRNIDFGLDQATNDGTRAFFKIRWLNYDEAGASRVSKFQLWDDAAGGTWTDITGGAVNLGYNENKRNLWHLEVDLDLETLVYNGVRINGQGFGTLADTPDSTLQVYAPPQNALVSFANGMNATVELYNRLDTNSTKAWMNLAYFRAVAT